MMHLLKTGSAALLIGGSLTLAAAPASAAAFLPMADVTQALPASGMIEKVHWVCDPYRCWHRPHHWHRHYWGPPPWRRGWY